MVRMVLPLADGLLPLGLFAAGVAILAATLLRRRFSTRQRQRRSSQQAIDTQPRPSSAWAGAEIDPDARSERAKVELEEFRREVLGQIDTRLLLLQELLARSEQSAQRLEELLAHPPGETGKAQPGEP